MFREQPLLAQEGDEGGEIEVRNHLPLESHPKEGIWIVAT